VSSFNLQALARQIWDELGGCDYHVLAKELDNRISRADADAVLAEVLIPWARTFAAVQRPALQHNPGRSPKVEAIRRAWPELRAFIFTQSGQKALRECTSGDLIFHAGLLERKAASLTTKADRYQQLAAALDNYQAQRVADLPDDVLGRFFTGTKAP
jgi:hypothetical protein